MTPKETSKQKTKAKSKPKAKAKAKAKAKPKSKAKVVYDGTQFVKVKVKATPIKTPKVAEAWATPLEEIVKWSPKKVKVKKR